MKLSFDLGHREYAEAFGIVNETFRLLRSEKSVNCRTIDGTFLFILRSWKEYMDSLRADAAEASGEKSMPMRLGNLK